MRRTLSLFLIIILIIAACSGCESNSKTASEQTASDSKIDIVTTIFPPYDFTRQIVGDKANVTMLLAPGAESHSYEPTPQDIIKIQNCDLFIYVGGENDEWVNSILDSMNKDKIQTIALLDCVKPIREELKEGMESEEENPSSSTDGVEYDEHVWTSPQNAILITNFIRDVLCHIDRNNAETYQSNAESYTERLYQLDKEFQDIVKNAKRNTIVFGDRFPLRYFTEAYGLNYWAAFPGCSAETEPSAATVAFLTDKVKAGKIPVVFKIELSNGNVAQSIADSAGAKVITFYSCHNLSKSDFDRGATYLDLMGKNVESLKKALN
ncbi:metal ABC transporter substrate-binding protein [Sinanaerobacter chloroacetimidivorans]|uniref:Zinc ABC transporter substrate-binding protein n=1 Tax=Sinanaerobacter chloroacetimidivorans TaxID=2818044 RepID=A0A8J7W0E9_9FIRM|nr:metal ABC transporter substrate-binding protein [Sinanaerobacter chloroacetimidivorans]MBR0598512.1 zinc ABC transporter substrate-binding protein [Sinanaerobacter chloroacetimidivorans]